MLDENSNLTQQWRLFFQDLYTRVGGNQAPSNLILATSSNGYASQITALQTATTGNTTNISSLTTTTNNNTAAIATLNAAPGAVAPVTVGASPFTFKASQKGALVISGGGLRRVEITRDGTTFYSTGAFRGMFPLSTNDSMRVTFTAVPVLTFFPT